MCSIDKVPSNGVEQTSFFGRLHQLIDSQNQDQPGQSFLELNILER